MKKNLSLIKALLSQDMNMFAFSVKSNSSKLKKVIFPIFLFLLVSVSIGTYAYMISSVLVKVHLTYIMLTMFFFLVSFLTFIQGIYKSQGILFDAKDNDLLFSLPISKSKILFMRIFKLLLFQYIYNLMFLLPALVIYIYYEMPNINFYIITFLMMLFVPISPTVISSSLGYIIKLVSSKFKRGKVVQTLLSSVLFFCIFFFSLNLDTYMENLAVKALSINDLITKIYYPIGLYISLINNFSLYNLLKLCFINISFLIIFVIFGSKFYYKIIFNIKIKNTKLNKDIKVKCNKPLKSLVIKELKRYFSSPIYMFNTSFGLIIFCFLTILLCIRKDILFKNVLSYYGVDSGISISFLFYFLVLFATSMTSITSSTISLERSTINLTKSLPIKESTIFKSKIIYPFIIELPFIIISEIVFFIKYKVSFLEIICIILVGLVMILFSSLFGLVINLMYPKMKSLNDTEVVKQSMSSMICVFFGMFIFIISIFGISYFSRYIDINILMIIHLLILFVICGILYYVLMSVGRKLYRRINV